MAKDGSAGGADRLWGWALLLGWIACAVYVWLHLDLGWIRHDEGALAHTADRALSGQLPHRDFIDTYTGGLAFYHALALNVLGENLVSIRIGLYAIYLAWLPVVYWICRRFVSRGLALLGTAVCAVASIPIYPAAMPSWYNLFFATFAAASVLRFAETRGLRWLVLAGVCAGISILAKIVGLYLAAAVLVWAVAWSGTDTGGSVEDVGSARAGSGTAGRAVISIALLLLLGMVVALTSRIGAYGLTLLLPPVAVVLAAVGWLHWRPAGVHPGALGRAIRLSAGFGAGLSIPILVFLVPYVLTGSIDDLLEGVFVVPLTRFEYASFPAPAPRRAFALLLPVAVVLAARYAPVSRRLLLTVTGLILVAVLALAAPVSLTGLRVYQFAWNSLSLAAPLTVPVAVWAAVRSWSRAGGSAADLRAPALLALASITGFFALIQIPHTGPVYLAYGIPLGVLTAVALSSYWTPSMRAALALLLLFFGAFAVGYLNRANLYELGIHRTLARPMPQLALARGGLRVPEPDRDIYEALVHALLRQGGSATLVTPDAPELYFLSGLDNPTPVLFDFMDVRRPDLRADRILAAIDSADVNAIVVNLKPGFSDPPPEALLSGLRTRYPETQRFGVVFEIWSRADTSRSASVAETRVPGGGSR